MGPPPSSPSRVGHACDRCADEVDGRALDGRELTFIDNRGPLAPRTGLPRVQAVP